MNARLKCLDSMYAVCAGDRRIHRLCLSSGARVERQAHCRSHVRGASAPDVSRARTKFNFTQADMQDVRVMLGECPMSTASARPEANSD